MTKIEWAEKTWNPIVGCTKVSPGCKNCYAVRMARRLAEMPHTRALYAPVTFFGKGDWNGKIGIADEKVWDKPHRWRKPRRIFVCSMGDLFHENVDYDAFARVMAAASVWDQHTYLILTKRPKRMREQVTAWCDHMKAGKPLSNVWLGVTAENQETADQRIPILLDTPAAVRFVSCEPLLGAVNLKMSRPPTDDDYQGWNGDGPIDRVITLVGTGLDWVIAGGESGPGARIMPADWVASLRDQCVDAGVAFFFKQWGDNHPLACMTRRGRDPEAKKGGRILDGQVHDAYPEVVR